MTGKENPFFKYSQQLAQLPAPLIYWYHQNARSFPWRELATPYHVWVSEVMLQQTRAETVVGYYNRFIDRLNTPAKLAEAEDDLLLKLWEGLGYYSRVRNLKRASIEIVEKYNGELPADYSQLCRLPGIGPYTAGAIASIAFRLPEPAVDGNVMRVITRITGDRSNISLPPVRGMVADALRPIYPKSDCASYTQALMELGAVVCIPNGRPRCEACPVSFLCKAYAKGMVQELPVKNKLRHREILKRTVLLMRKKEAYAVIQRPKDGLLGGLWEFPSYDGELTEEEVLQKTGALKPFSVTDIGQSIHVFTHLEWHMRGYLVECADTCGDFVWADRQTLLSDYAFPSALRFYRDQL